MDPRGNIYKSDDVPAADEARLQIHLEELARAGQKAHEDYVRDQERRLDEYGDDLLQKAGVDPDEYRRINGLPPRKPDPEEQEET